MVYGILMGNRSEYCYFTQEKLAALFLELQLISFILLAQTHR